MNEWDKLLANRLDWLHNDEIVYKLSLAIFYKYHALYGFAELLRYLPLSEI